MAQPEPPASCYLTSRGIPHRVFHHPNPVHSLEQAASERMQRPDQVVRSLLFRLSESDFVMVLVAGPAQIAWPKLRQYLGVRRITTATEQEVFQVTGYSIGAVSPFGPNMAIRILADANIFAPEEISLGSGERYTAIIINKDDLRKALGNVEIGSFV